MRRFMIAGLQLWITAACFVWLFSRPEIGDGLWSALKASDPVCALWGIALAGLMVFFGILRWQLFLHVQGLSVPLSETARLSLVGGFFNLVLFGTIGGDAIKIVSLLRRYPERKKDVCLSVLLDRISGMSGVVFFFFAFSLPRHGWFHGSFVSTQLLAIASVYLIGAFAGVILVVVLAATGWLEKTSPRLPGRAIALALAHGMTVFVRHKTLSSVAIVLSILIHLTYFACFYVAGRSVRAGLPFLDTLTIMPVVDSIASLPIAVSGLGLRETLFERLLHQQLAIPSEAAVSLSLLGFGYTVVWSLAGALVFLWGGRVRIDGVRSDWRAVVRDAGKE